MRGVVSIIIIITTIFFKEHRVRAEKSYFSPLLPIPKSEVGPRTPPVTPGYCKVLCHVHSLHGHISVIEMLSSV